MERGGVRLGLNRAGLLFKECARMFVRPREDEHAPASCSTVERD